MPATQVLVIASTNRPASLTRVVADKYRTLLEQQGAQTELLDLAYLPADFTHSALYRHAGQHPNFNQLLERLRRYRKYVFVVPQYNGSFPGVLKAFIDGIPQPKALFQGRKCALVGVSQGRQGAIMGLSHLSDIFHYLGMSVLAMQPKLHSVAAPTEEALAAHPGYLERLQAQVAALLTF